MTETIAARLVRCGLVASLMMTAGLAEAQVGSFSREDLIDLTSALER